MAATEPIRDKGDLKKMADHCLRLGQFRNHLLIVMGACTALRIGDLLRLRWSDVYDEAARNFRDRVTLTEDKTGKTKSVALNAQVVRALRLCLPFRRDAFLFSNNRKAPAPIGRVQAWRIIKAAALAAGVACMVSCHSLRKTWGYHAWRSGLVSPVVIMQVFNHTSYETTRRYLGVTQDDLDRAYLGLSLF